jgi:aminotransferase
MWERTVVVNGFSKAFAMTGWRIGYALGPVPIIKAMTKLHQFAIMCAPTMAQEAAIAALSPETEAAVQDMVEEYDARRRMLLGRLEKMGVPCFEPKGAFYIFPCIKKFGMTSEEFCEKFLYDEHVAVVPGSAFGESGEGFIRISYAKSMSDLSKAMDRLERFLSKL